MEIKSHNDEIKNAFNSILRADYISLDKVHQLSQLESYYIDFFNNVSSALLKQDNFICGRRGTGKTALLMRSYYECLKTVSPSLKDKSKKISNEKILPIYIDLSTCTDLFDPQNELSTIELHFIRQIIESLNRQLNVMFDEGWLKIFRKENPALEELEFIEKAIVEGMTLSTSRIQEKISKSVENNSVSISARLSKDPSMSGGITDQSTTENTYKSKELWGLNVQEFLNKISDIRKKAEIDYIYIFIDEFSDLNIESQVTFSRILKNLLGNKIDIYFKLGVITDRFDFGDKVIIGRDIFPITLDLNEHVERFGGSVIAFKKMVEFIHNLIEKRLEIFCPDISIDDILRAKKDIFYQRIAREAVGIPRTIGLILQIAWSQAQTKDGKIGLQELSYGIRSTRKTYQRQFEGSIKKKLIPGFYMDLWDSILSRATEEKK